MLFRFAKLIVTDKGFRKLTRDAAAEVCGNPYARRALRVLGLFAFSACYVVGVTWLQLGSRQALSTGISIVVGCVVALLVAAVLNWIGVPVFSSLAILALAKKREDWEPVWALWGASIATYIPTLAFFLLAFGVGSSTPFVDAGAFVLASWVLARTLDRKVLGSTLVDQSKVWVVCALRVCVCWIVLSITFLVGPTAERTIPQNPFRSTVDSARNRVALLLSGGGYRATLFHAGVLSGLRDLGVPVSIVVGVSGGAITAAQFASGGRPEDLVTSIGAGQMLLRHELLSFQNVVRWPCSIHLYSGAKLFPFCSFSRVQLQQGLLDRNILYNRAFPNRSSGRAELVIGATDLYTGSAVAFYSGGVVRHSIGVRTASNEAKELDQSLACPGGVSVDLSAQSVPLSQVVAASGAFPGAFDSVPFALESAPTGCRKLELADGGIRDNSGLLYLSTVAEFETSRGNPGWRPDTLIISDAGNHLHRLDDSGVLSQLGQTVDVIYEASQSFNQSLLKDAERIELLPAPGSTVAALASADDRAEADVTALLMGMLLQGDGGGPDSLRRFLGLESIKGLVPFVGNALVTFLQTGTLEDRIGKDSATDLFRLGRYVVWREAKRLKGHTVQPAAF
jgi:predicted acylesterase/phospholipase RssA